MTGALNRINIEGRNGRQLREKWHGGARSYLGPQPLQDFQTFFTVTGPGSPSVLTNMLPSIEQHVEWIDRCISDLRKSGKTEIEAEVVAEDNWVDHVNETAELSAPLGVLILNSKGPMSLANQGFSCRTLEDSPVM